MRVLILGGSNSRNSGGVFETTRALGSNLSEKYGLDVHFLMMSDEYSNEDRKHYGDLPLHNYKSIGPTNLGFSLDMYNQIEKIEPDVIHTQSLWMYLSRVNKDYCSTTQTPYIVSPHGMLDSWQLKQSVWKKKLALALYEQKHLENAACICALGADEYEAIRNFGLRNPVAIIPNGVDLPDSGVQNLDRSTRQQGINRAERKTLLFLGRIHPKKGLGHTLLAWSMLGAARHAWQLVIAGEAKDSQYIASLERMVSDLGMQDSVKFVGGQYGDGKKACFRQADAFILSSFSEGLPMSVLEAWAYRLPVIMTQFCNLPEGFEKLAAIKVEPTAENVAQGIRSIVSMSDETRGMMGLNGFNLVKEKFTWDSVAGSTLELYRWVLGKAEKPEFVLT